MAKDKGLNRIDFNQIKEERKNTLEFFLIVLALGLFVNLIASGIYQYFDIQNQEIALIVIVAFVILIIIVIFILIGLIRPVVLNVEIPIALFWDQQLQTFSVPSQIHHPSENRIPFPILSRIYFDNYKEFTGLSEFELANDTLLSDDNWVKLIQSIIFSKYSEEHMPLWLPFKEIKIGPFNTGIQKDVNNKIYSFNDLASVLKNDFFLVNGGNQLVNLPSDTDVEFKSTGELILKGASFTTEISIMPRACNPLINWNLARGTTSSWYREMSSNYDHTIAMLFVLQVNFRMKRVIWRIFGERNLPSKYQPNTTLEDLCDWINDWVLSMQTLFEWVDEDFDEIPNKEIATLINESNLTYKSGIEGAPPTMFYPRHEG